MRLTVDPQTRDPRSPSCRFFADTFPYKQSSLIKKETHKKKTQAAGSLQDVFFFLVKLRTREPQEFPEDLLPEPRELQPEESSELSASPGIWMGNWGFERVPGFLLGPPATCQLLLFLFWLGRVPLLK